MSGAEGWSGHNDFPRRRASRGEDDMIRTLEPRTAVRRTLIAIPILLAALTGCTSTPADPSPTTTVPDTTPIVTSPLATPPPTLVTQAASSSASDDFTPSTKPDTPPEPYFVRCISDATGATQISDGTIEFSSNCIAEKPRLSEVPLPLPAPPAVVPEYVETTTTVAPYNPNPTLPPEYGLTVTLGTTCTKGSTGHTSEGLAAYCVPAPGFPSYGYVWAQ